MVNRFLIFSSILATLWLLHSLGSKSVSNSIIIYYDNSISSSLGVGLIDFEVLFGELKLKAKEASVTFVDNSSQKRSGNNLGNGLENDRTVFSRGTADVLASENRNKSSYFFISDFQEESIDDISKSLNDTTSQYHFVIHNDLNNIRNAFVDTLYVLPSLDDISNFSIFLKLRVDNYTTGNIVIKLLNGERQVSSIVKDVSEIDVVKFDIPKDQYGSYKIVLEGDDVTYDNHFYFVLDEKSKLNITIVDNGNADFLKEVFGNNNLFNLRVFDLNSLAYQEIENSDLIILNDFHELPTSLFSQLPKATFLILPDDSIDLKSYTEIVNLDFESTSPSQSEINFDFNHPLFQGVFEKKFNSGLNPKSTPVFRIRGEYDQIINYRSGEPFLLEKKQIYLLNLILNENTTFQSNALFIPILYQIAFSVSGELVESYSYPGSNIALRTESSTETIRLKNYAVEHVPEQNMIDGQIFLQIPSQLKPGTYWVLSGEDTIRSIAVNLPKSESAMLAPTLSDFSNAFSSMNNVSVSEVFESRDQSLLLTLESQTSLWKYALILALLFIVIETLFHRYLK